MNDSKVTCRYCNTSVLRAEYRQHCGPCYEAHYNADGTRKSLSKNTSSSKSSNRKTGKQSHSQEHFRSQGRHDTARPFSGDGAKNWGYGARYEGRYGSHASFDDYSDESWS